MNILDTLKYKFKHADIVEKLIYINLAVFLAVFVINTFGYLFQLNANFLVKWFALPAAFDDFWYKPWTLFSYGFLHTSFLHILFNLIALYYIGNLFKQYFTDKQLLNFYFYGTFVGGLIFILSYNFFPVFQKVAHESVLLGASAGISAIFVGVATYIPNYEIKFPLIGYVKLWILACIWVSLDIIQIPAGNAGGHLAHLGGAIFGYLYVNYTSNKEITFNNPLKELFKKKSPLKTVYKSENTTKSYSSKKYKSPTQQEIDLILDKISKSGYETLSKEEKEFLFKQGKK